MKNLIYLLILLLPLGVMAQSNNAYGYQVLKCDVQVMYKVDNIVLLKPTKITSKTFRVLASDFDGIKPIINDELEIMLQVSNKEFDKKQPYAKILFYQYEEAFKNRMKRRIEDSLKVRPITTY